MDAPPPVGCVKNCESFVLLPPIGAEIPQSYLSINTSMEYQGSTISVDFRGGIKDRVDVDRDDPENSVRLRTVGHKSSAEAEDGTALVLEQKDIDTEAPSTLKAVSKHPPKFAVRRVLQVTLSAGADNKIVAQTKADAPMVLTTTLTQWPPRGDLFQLESPVDLVDPEDENIVVARLLKFPVKMGGL
uniref:hypothetical protein n=1 Tax=Streptomyces sp. NBC_01592 TaxID=2975889 RepID=UPI002F9066D7